MRSLVTFPIITTASFRARLRFWLIAALLAELYFVVGKLSLNFASLHPSASPVWPPTGIALAMLLLLGRRYWISILAGAFLVNVTTEGSLPAVAVIAAGNTLEAVAGFLLVERFVGKDRAFRTVSGVLVFFLFAALSAPVIAASFGVTSLLLDGSLARDAVGPVWFTWWIGDAVGALTVAPPIVLWCTRPHARRERAKTWEYLALWLVLLAAGFVVFTPYGVPLIYLCYVPLLWVALRFTPRDTALCIAVVSAAAIVGTLNGHGPFALIGGTTQVSLLVLQMFLVMFAFIGLLVSTATLERRIAQSSLEKKVSERTDELERCRIVDRANVEFLRTALDQLTVAAIIVNERLIVISMNGQSRDLFRLRERATPRTLSDVFATIRSAFKEPHESVDGLLQMLEERRKRTGHGLELESGATILCDYTPIFVDDVHRGHMFLFRETPNVF